MFDAGLFGRKTGKGWYEYEDSKPKERPSPDFVTKARPARRVALASDETLSLGLFDAFVEDNAGDLGDLRDELTNDDRLREFCDEIKLKIVEDDGECPLIAAPVGHDATYVASDIADSERVICIDLLGDISKRVSVMSPPGADRELLAGVAAAIAASGRAVTWINDSPGFVGQRMAAMVANLGCYMAEIGLASPEDIDTAMELGLNYPRGSIALGQEMGAATCYQALNAIQEITGEDRYRPAQWLRRRALLGLSLYTPN
jgi:3-hydroxybutyryl-CoA dehydrogenase